MCMHPPTLPPPPPIQWLHCKSWTVFVSHCAQALCSGQLDLLVPGRDALLGCSRLDFHFGSRITEGTYWFPCLCHSYRVWMERFMRSGQLVMHYSHYINYSQWLYRESPIKWTVSNRQVNSLASWLTGPVHIAQSQFHFLVAILTCFQFLCLVVVLCSRVDCVWLSIDWPVLCLLLSLFNLSPLCSHPLWLLILISIQWLLLSLFACPHSLQWREWIQGNRNIVSFFLVPPVAFDSLVRVSFVLFDFNSV